MGECASSSGTPSATEYFFSSKRFLLRGEAGLFVCFCFRFSEFDLLKLLNFTNLSIVEQNFVMCHGCYCISCIHQKNYGTFPAWVNIASWIEKRYEALAVKLPCLHSKNTATGNA